MKTDKPHISQLPKLRDLWKEAFGDTDEFLDKFYKTAFSTERCRCVTVNEEIAAALYWFDCIYMDKPIAYLYAVATAEEFRGQGICRKLMSDTHEHLTGLGYEGVILVPGGDELFKFYEKMGYKTCSYIRQFSCKGEDNKLKLRSIDKKEYGSLRRKYLPIGGVIQENENIDFLETQAKFYTGEGFLLAANVENNILYGAELLGDTSTAPALVSALCCPEGKFRTPGTDKPYAMYHPLGKSTLQPPDYFGLSFG